MRHVHQIVLLAALSSGIAFITGAAPTVTNVTATYTAFTNTLNLSGDAGNNTVTMTSQNGMLTLTGSNGTKVNGANTWSINHTGAINMTGNLGAGDDSLTIVTSTVTIPSLQLGPGNDIFTVKTSKISIGTLDGGPGSDRFVMQGSSSLSIKTFVSMP